MKTNAIIRIVIFCLLIVLLLSILVVGIGFRRYAFQWNFSFTTGAWYITWVIFPILGALDKLLCTILQNKEAMNSDIRFPSKGKLRKSINGMIWAVGLALYFLVGFATGGWYTIWLFLPLIGAVQGLVKAILDLKEVMDNEE